MKLTRGLLVALAALTVGAVLLVLVVVSLVSFHAGTRHGDIADTSKKTLESQRLPGTRQHVADANVAYGPHVNFGSITVQGTVQAVGGNGLVVQTAGGNVLTVLVSTDSIALNPSGKKVRVAQLQAHDTVSIVARLNDYGQFVALRVVQE